LHWSARVVVERHIELSGDEARALELSAQTTLLDEAPQEGVASLRIGGAQGLDQPSRLLVGVGQDTLRIERDGHAWLQFRFGRIDLQPDARYLADVEPEKGDLRPDTQAAQRFLEVKDEMGSD